MNDLKRKKEIETAATSCYCILFTKLIAYSCCFHFRRRCQNSKQWKHVCVCVNDFWFVNFNWLHTHTHKLKWHTNTKNSSSVLHFDNDDDNNSWKYCCFCYFVCMCFFLLRTFLCAFYCKRNRKKNTKKEIYDRLKLKVNFLC